MNTLLLLEEDRVNFNKFYQLSNYCGKILIIQISYLISKFLPPFYIKKKQTKKPSKLIVCDSEENSQNSVSWSHNWPGTTLTACPLQAGDAFSNQNLIQFPQTSLLHLKSSYKVSGIKNNPGRNTSSNASWAFTNQQKLKKSTQSTVNTAPFKEAQHIQE